MTLERWLDLMKGLGLKEHREMFKRIFGAYSERHRHYHTVAHIDACLRELDRARSLARFPWEVEAALWFHDFVYAPSASDNERRSADLAVRFLATAGLPSEACARVHGHVMSTQHNAGPTDPDSVLVVDVDLSILGQEPDIYDQFETQVRREYRLVPGFVFRRKRSEILRSFLERESIYRTPPFHLRYESQARVNLARAIEALAG